MSETALHPSAQPSSRRERIAILLQQGLTPTKLEIQDDSARHAHHVHMRDNGVQAGESHYNVLVISPAFNGVGRVQRSRMVHDLLAEEFRSGLHALSLVLHGEQTL